MNEAGKVQVTRWLRAAPAVRGTLLRGVRFPDQTLVSDAAEQHLPAGALEQAWRVVADTCQVLSAQHFPPNRLSWVYDRSVLHCLQRPDGLMLGVLMARKIADADLDGLNRLFAEFQGLAVTETAAGAGG